MGKGEINIIKIVRKIRKAMPLSFKDQLSRKPEYRNGSLKLKRRSPEGDVLRADEARRMVSLTQEHGKAIAAMRKKMDTSPVDIKIEIPPEQIITIHSEALQRDFQLFLLTIGFLKNFSENQLVDVLLHRPINSTKKDHEMPGYIKLYEALDLLKVINPSLLGNIRLRLPAEVLIEMFYTCPDPECAEKRERIPDTLTASRFVDREVKRDEFDIELKKDEVHDHDWFVYYSGFRDPQDGQYKTSRWKVNPSGTLNTSLIFEVVPK